MFFDENRKLSPTSQLQNEIILIFYVSKIPTRFALDRNALNPDTNSIQN